MHMFTVHSGSKTGVFHTSYMEHTYHKLVSRVWDYSDLLLVEALLNALDHHQHVLWAVGHHYIHLHV